MMEIRYGDCPKVAVLIKENAFKISCNIEKYYVSPLVDLGVAMSDIMVLPLSYDKKKVSVKYAKIWLNDIYENLPESVTTLLVTDGEYFKVLTGARKADPHTGYIMPCTYEKFEDLSCTLSVNFQALVYNPELQGKLTRSLEVVQSHLQNTYSAPGAGIIKEEYYPKTVEDIRDWLEKLHQYPKLACDIEGFSLKFMDCGIGTISFCWNEHCGVAFPVDLQIFGQDAQKVRQLLISFFISYKGHLIYHNSSFDVKVLIYQLFMQNLGDYHGLLRGLDIMTRKLHDTKLIAYLALNKCGRTSYKLKDLAQEFAGNWAQDDIHDITKIDQDDLLRYNLVDGLSTWHLYNKYTPALLDAQQEGIYFDMFIPAVKVLLQTELVGMPIDPVKVQEAKKILQDIADDHINFLINNTTIQSFQREQRIKMAEKDNATRLEKSKTKKVKIKTWKDFVDSQFNPNSNDQVKELLYEFMGYEAVDFTESKEPAVGAKTLKKVRNQSRTEDDRAIFNHLIGLSKAMKVLTSFIPAFENARELPDGSFRLYGNFNLGGTQSGRLCVSGDTEIHTDKGLLHIKDIVTQSTQCGILTHKGRYKDVIGYYYKGEEEMYDVTLQTGKTIRCTLGHVFYTDHGWLSLRDIMASDKEICIYELN